MTAQANFETDWRNLVVRLAAMFETTRIGASVGEFADAPLGHLPVVATAPTVVRHFERALGNSCAATEPVCWLLGRLQHHLRWNQNPSYTDAEFLHGYAYCELLGPNGLQRAAGVSMGLLLLGPHITYPQHVHPATELYVVIAGHAQWSQGDGKWRGRAPAERIRHASMEPHAMRTADEPLLAAYLWQDHLDHGARLVADAQHLEDRR